MDFTDKRYDDVALPAGPSDIDMTRLFDGFYTSAYVALGSGPNFISLGISEVRISAVPLPTTAWLFGSAFLGLSIVRRKKL